MLNQVLKVFTGIRQHSVEVLSKSVTFLDFWLSQGSVATYCRCGNLCDVYIKNFLTNHLVKNFWKSVHVCQSDYFTAPWALQCLWHDGVTLISPLLIIMSNIKWLTFFGTRCTMRTQIFSLHVWTTTNKCPSHNNHNIWTDTDYRGWLIMPILWVCAYVSSRWWWMECGLTSDGTFEDPVTSSGRDTRSA